MNYLGLKMLDVLDNMPCAIIEGVSYVLINRIEKTEHHKEYSGKRIYVRCDIMTANHEPVISFQSMYPEVLRKHVIDAMLKQHDSDNARGNFTHEHAAYIGFEIRRAFADGRYIQD